MEVNTKSKTGFVVLTTSFEYNDEIHYQIDGYSLNDKHVYATKQEASAELVERVNLEFGWLKLGDLWYSGDEPELVQIYAQSMYGHDYGYLSDTDSYVPDFIAWCEAHGHDYTEAIFLYNIVEVTID